jgi:L-aspartate-alpha-decarboxylase
MAGASPMELVLMGVAGCSAIDMISILKKQRQEITSFNAEVEGERVQVVNINNGERIETYVIKGEAKSGTICLNGPAARKVAYGDLVIIIGYGIMDFEEAKTFKPSLVFPNSETNLID